MDPAPTYRLFGTDTSPYVQKVRSFLTYKGVAFEWIDRPMATEHIATALLLITPEGPSLKDSTRILAEIEAAHPHPVTTPPEAGLAALALLLEDFGDEWLTKCMVQQRWALMPDRVAAAHRAVSAAAPKTGASNQQIAARAVSTQMLDHLARIGAEPDNWATLEASYRRFALRLNAHLKHHLFIFGGQPTAADFSIAAVFSQMLTDPTPGAWLEEKTPFLVTWADHMRHPRASGGYAGLAALAPTFKPLFESEIVRTYLPWAAANAASAERDRGRFSVTLADGLFEQSTQRYAARTFRNISQTVQAATESSALARFLQATGASGYILPRTADIAL